jgi:UDP-N-acetylglucosamine 2-epimerase
MVLEENARLIATDSGGVQREAYFAGVPCLTLREETEWIETVQAGWNLLVGVEPQTVIDAWYSFAPPAEHPPIFGDGTAGQRIVRILEDRPVAFGLPR